MILVLPHMISSSRKLRAFNFEAWGAVRWAHQEPPSSSSPLSTGERMNFMNNTIWMCSKVNYIIIHPSLNNPTTSLISPFEKPLYTLYPHPREKKSLAFFRKRSIRHITSRFFEFLNFLNF